MYAHVLNNPLSTIDPTGLCSQNANDAGNFYDDDDHEVLIHEGACTPEDLGGATTVSVVDEPSSVPYDWDCLLCRFSIGGGDNVANLPLTTAPNSGLTKKQLACAADAAINGALGIIVPGYAATKAAASFAGFSFNPIGALTGTSGLFSAGNPTALQTVSGLAGANYLYRDVEFAAAGGASALTRVQDLTSRASFGLQTASRQSRLLSQLGNLESLEGAANFASKANNIAAGISAGYDIYKCVTTP